MVRCVNCGHLNRKTRWCHGYKTRIKLKDIHKQIPCEKYVPRHSKYWRPNRAEVKQHG